MAIPIMMPKQGQTVESCILIEWHKEVGEPVKKGDILFTYETDKASFEFESEDDGILLGVFFGEGDEVPVLANIAVLGEEGESVEEFNPHTTEGKITTQTDQEPEAATEKNTLEKSEISLYTSEREAESKEQEKVNISPRAKKLAEKHKILYRHLRGTGPYGRIIEQDIQKAIKEGPQATSLAFQMSQDKEIAPSQEASGIAGRFTVQNLVVREQIYQEDHEVKKLTNIRKIIASSMRKSLQNTAQLTHHTSASAQNIMELRAKIKDKRDKGLSPDITLNDMVCYAVIQALKIHPDANAHLIDMDHIRIFHKVHLAFAVDTNRGLMVPVVRNADDLSLEGLSKQMKALSERCRQGNIDPELISSEAASFTVSNLGAYGVEMFTPILNIPQVAILGVTTIAKRWTELKNGTFGFVPYIGLSLTYDHSAIDGGPASLFLNTVKEGIEQFKQ